MRQKKRGITIGIATRNAEECLPGCLRSLAAQTIQPAEYVICIGPSSDRTEDLVMEFKKSIGVPTKIIYDIGGIGTGYARNAIVEEATQEYISWVDSDYLMPPNWVEVITDLIEGFDFDTLEMNENNIIEVTKEKLLQMKGIEPINITTPTISWGTAGHSHVFKRNTALRIFGYDPFFARGQDKDMGIRYKAVGIKGMICKELFFIHSGLLDYSKTLDRTTFFKFLYKYGPEYVLFGGACTEQALGFLVRSGVLFSFLGATVFALIGLPVIYPLSLSVLFFVVLCVGAQLLHGSSHGFSKVEPRYFVGQLGKCISEWQVLYQILVFKNRSRFGYGRDILRKLRQQSKAEMGNGDVEINEYTE